MMIVSRAATLLSSDKPPKDVILATTRGEGLPGFYLSSSIITLLREFPKSYKLRTAYGMGWSQADSIAMEPEACANAFQYGQIPSIIIPPDDDMTRFEDNIPLMVFHWTLRRFIEAPKYCTVSTCGAQADDRIVAWQWRSRR
jgi:hypothetical protein